MARVVLGIGASHGPMLSTPPALWSLRAKDDRRDPALHYRGRTWTYPQLEAERAGEDLPAQLTDEVKQKRFDACQAAIGELARAFEAARPDAVVLIGNDQMEMFWDGLVPMFTVYWGQTIPNRLPPAEAAARLPEGIRVAMRANAPDDPVEYPGCPELGLHLLDRIQGEGFDLASMQKIPPHRGDWRSIPHAFGFIFHRIMKDAAPPTVPIVQNTFYPPNQPRVARSIAFGRALAKALQDWESDARVAVIGSGGLSHFVVDEAVDQVILDAIRSGRAERLLDLDEADFQSGTSETKNWIPVIAAMAEIGLKPRVVDYVPCYRSTAGTGNAMGFVTWS